MKLKYIKQNILKLFIYFLYSSQELELSKIDFQDTALFIKYIILNDFCDSFYFRINKNEMNKYHELFDNKEKYEKNTVGRLYQLVEERGNDEEISFNDLIEGYENLISDFFLVYIFYNIVIYPSGKLKLQKLLDEYIDYYQNGALTSEKNYYPMDASIKEVCKNLTSYYDNYGSRFNINNESIDNKQIRLFELLLLMQKRGLIEIKDCNFKNELFNINIDMKKSPKEIQDILGYWKSYGDLRINEDDGVAFYKGNKLPFSRTGTKEFELLKILMKDPGNKIPIDEIYSSIYKNQFNQREKRKIITELVTQVREKLNINEDPKPTISLIVEGENVLLIANPP